MALQNQDLHRLDRMEDHQRNMKEKVDDIDKKVTQIYKSIVGDRSMGNIGMAERLQDLEVEMSLSKKEIRDLRDEKIRNDLYVKILTFLAGVLTVAIITGFIRGWIKLG
jgi:hypothetical protein